VNTEHGTLLLVPLSLIDEPEIPMRESMDEDALAGLAVSIRENGIVEPIIVRPKLGRFVVIAGHRRTLASRKAGLVEVPCVVRDVDGATVEQLKVAENTDREAVNPGEEATYYAHLYERFCHSDIDELARFTGRNRSYLDQRFELLAGHPDVLEAVKRGEINVSVAKELNRFPDAAGIKMHLESARSGATAALVKRWRTDYQAFRANNPIDAPAPAPSETVMSAAPIVRGPVCVCCKVDEDPTRLVVVYVHDYCHKAVLEKLLRAYRGEEATLAG
jgi:ParB/RepB/Spo0J family partition protein